MKKINYALTYFVNINKNPDFYKRLILSLSYNYKENLSLLERNPISISFKFNYLKNYIIDIRTCSYIPTPSEAKRLDLKELVDFGIENQSFNFKINLEDKSEEIIEILEDLGFELNNELIPDKYLLVKNSSLHFISNYKTFCETDEIELFIEDIYFLEEEILQFDFLTKVINIQDKNIKIKILTLIKLLNYREKFLKEKYNCWEPDWTDKSKTKYCIEFDFNCSRLKTNNYIFYERMFSFPDENSAQEFINKYSKGFSKIKDLL